MLNSMRVPHWKRILARYHLEPQTQAGCEPGKSAFLATFWFAAEGRGIQLLLALTMTEDTSRYIA